MSAVWLAVIAVVSTVSIGLWVAIVLLSQRRQANEHPHMEPRRGRVQGGTHVGGGRSVGPRRDAEISPDDNPEDPTVPVRHGTSPMDL